MIDQYSVLITPIEAACHQLIETVPLVHRGYLESQHWQYQVLVVFDIFHGLTLLQA